MSLRSRSLEKSCIALVDLRKGISSGEVSPERRSKSCMASGPANAFSTVGGPLIEEPLWNEVGELGQGDVESRVGKFEFLPRSGIIFLHPQCGPSLVYIRIVSE